MTDNNKRMRQVLGQVLGLPIDAVTDAAEMDAVEGWDSLKHLRVVLALEEAFGVSFDEEIALEITSVPKIREALADLGVDF